MDHDALQLLSSCRIGRMTVKNRVVFPPMNTNFSNVGGEVTQQETEYYTARARGGCGLIVVEATSIDAMSKKHGLQPMLYGEQYVAGYAKMVEKIHRYGAKASVEIIHYGAETPYPDGYKLSSSSVSSIPGNQVRPMTIAEIQTVEEQFVRTAEYARLAGFDAVTYHATHGYLIAQFLSPLYNHREDEYGGSFTNRFRFLREIIEKTKERLGKAYPVIVRFSADEYIEGGRTLDESILLARALEQCGVDALDISAAVPSSYMFTIAPGSLTGMKGLQKENAKAIKAAVKIPVLVAGGIRTPEMAEEFLQEGAADLICLGRAQIADPDFVNKVRSNAVDSIRPCISCLTCFYSLGEKKCLHCAVNPEAGREYDLTTPEKVQDKRAVVVGAGPAGMQAALSLSERGYDTYLYEKRDYLGGSLLPASIPSGKGDIKKLLGWYACQLNKNHVHVMLNAEFSEKNDNSTADVMIDATGGVFSRRISGSSSSHVITAAEALIHPDQVGENVVIIGAGNTGCESAEYLSGNETEISFLRVKDFSGDLEYKVNKRTKQKRKVTLVEFMPTYGNGIGRLHKPLLDIRLKENNVNILVSTKVNQINDDGTVEIENMVNGTIQLLKADTVILAGGMLPAPDSIPEQQDYGIRIGDALTIGKIDSAICDGYFIGREV